MLDAERLVATVLPALALALAARRLARPRPGWAVSAAAFVLGGASCLLAARLAPDLDGVSSPYLRGLVSAFVEAALPEEVTRLAVVAVLSGVFVRRGDAGPRASMAVGAIAGLGFGAAEAVFGALGGEDLPRLLIGRTVTAAGHGLGGLILGTFLARRGPGARGFLGAAARGLALCLTLHTLYDFAVGTEVPGADDLPDDALPPAPALALMGLFAAVVLAYVVLAVVLVRATREGGRAGTRQGDGEGPHDAP